MGTEKSVLNRGVFLQIPYMKVLADPVVAIVLSQIHYWYSPSKGGKSKLRVIKQGKFWIAKSRKEWGDETGLSDAQVRRALDVLEEKGVIEKEVFRFYGAPTIHLRAIGVQGRGPLKEGEWLMLIPAEFGVSGNVTGPLVTGEDSEGAQHQPSVTGNQSITEIKQETDQKPSQHIPASDDATASGKAIKTIDTPGKKETGEGNSQGANKPVGASTATDVGVLQQTWKKLLAEHFSDQVFLDLTKKDAGQLSRLAKQLGANAIPIVSLAISDWGKFKKFAKERSGAFQLPLVPTISFLLKYAEDAANYWQASCKTVEAMKKYKAAAEEKQKEYDLLLAEAKAKKAKKLTDPGGEPMSVEELLAFGAKFKPF